MTQPAQPLSSLMLKAAIYGAFQGVGQREVPVGDVQARFWDANGDDRITPGELRDAMGQDRVVLSLREAPEAGRVAMRVAMYMDAADGRQDGTIAFERPSQVPTDVPWPRPGLDPMTAREMADRLQSGEFVIGHQLMSRDDARWHGFDLAAIQPAASGGVEMVRSFE